MQLGRRKNAPAEDVVELRRELDVVLLEVLVQLVRAEDFGDLDQLVLCPMAAASSPSVSPGR